MSISYYERKMVGGYVYMAGRYKKITNIRYTESYANNPPSRRLNYPEEYLPHILFQVGDDMVVWDDFEIKFPEERYAMINKRVVYGSRTMSQAYQIVPNPSNYNLSDDNCRFVDWLNAASDKFDPKETILNWDKDALFSDRLMATTDGNNRVVYYCGKNVIVLRREGDRQLGKVTAELLVRKLTKEIDLWPQLTEGAVVEESGEDNIPSPYHEVMRDWARYDNQVNPAPQLGTFGVPIGTTHQQDVAAGNESRLAGAIRRMDVHRLQDIPTPAPAPQPTFEDVDRLRQMVEQEQNELTQPTEFTNQIEGLHLQWRFKDPMTGPLNSNWQYTFRRTRAAIREVFKLFYRVHGQTLTARSLEEIENLREDLGELNTDDLLKIFTHLRDNS
jgi:hypothetical protein